MDPITQGVLGAAAGQLKSKPAHLFYAMVLGALGGMAADLDVLIRSTTDPMLALSFHRHFTHSLFFIPFGGALCGIALYFVIAMRWGLSLLQTITFCMLGYATHALLDGCTSYGTQLLWPLSDRRFSWDIVSVIDGFFTLPLLVAVWLTVKKRSKGWLIAGLGWGACYLGIGYVQHERAVQIGQEIAAARQHTPMLIEAKPSFGNIIVWKVIYEYDGVFYVDGVKPGLSNSTVWQGRSIAKLNLEKDFPWLDKTSQQYRDVEKFNWFSAGYTARDPVRPNRIVDIRYSMLPHEIEPLWGIELSQDKQVDEHVIYFAQRSDAGQAMQTLLDMVFQ